MVSEDVSVGGEESGGYTWKGGLPDRDGVLCALLFLEIMQKTGKKSSELAADIEKLYGKSVFLRKDFRLNKVIPDNLVFAEKLRKKLPKKILGHAIAEQGTIDGLKIILDDDSWVLIRASGTEPLLRIYAESPVTSTTEGLIEYAAKLTATHLKT